MQPFLFMKQTNTSQKKKEGWFTRLFKDSNEINEKSVLGFSAFFIMFGFAMADIITGALGKELVINEFIYNSFLIITLGALGVSSVDKYINNKSDDSSTE
jgi:hypothetical protein